MKNAWVKKLMPHAIAVVIFAVIAIFYCLPAMEGKQLEQFDIKQFNGAFQDSKNYAEKNNGKYPLWNNNMFGGMPNFQIGGTTTVINPAGYVHTILSLGLPKPANFFFLACICFYIMAMCFRVRPIVGIIVSIAYAYATYNPIIIGAGHETKMMTISYMPVILGGIYLILQKKYWLGGVITAVFSYLTISANHLQMFYYLGFALAFMAIAYVIEYVRKGNFKHLAFSFIIAVGAVGLGVASNAQNLMGSFEYQKLTQRGGPSELTDTTKKETSKDGLDKEYAMSYSMYKTEPLVMFVPKLFGGGGPKQYANSEPEFEVPADKSSALKADEEINPKLKQELAKEGLMPSWYNTYWGGIGGTDGPPYSGAILIVLAILGFFFLRNEERWWPVAGLAIIAAISAGSYFDSFNGFMYHNFPLFNKFRAPSSALTVAHLMISVLAVLGLDRMITKTMEKKENNFEKAKQNSKFIYGVITVGGLLFMVLVFMFTANFKSEYDLRIEKFIKASGNPEVIDSVKNVLKGLIADRKSLAWLSFGRTILFSLIGIGFIYALTKKMIEWKIVAIVLGAFMFIDVATLNHHYFNSKKFVSAEENEANFTIPPSDENVKKDQSDFRVLNQRGKNPFAEATASYNYRSIGGYHSVKLRIYQDLIENKMNNQVINMLNVKYVLDANGQQPVVQVNPGALGSAWFVKNVSFVKNADAEMAALDNLNPKDTSVVQEKFKASIPFAIEADTTAKIELIKNNNDFIEYKATNAKNAFAVFSEIYYPAGWKAYVDGKETPIVKTNYAFRGLALTPGTHKIEFKFLPEGYAKGTQIGNICAIIMGLLLLSLAYLGYKEYKKNESAA